MRSRPAHHGISKRMRLYAEKMQGYTNESRCCRLYFLTLGLVIVVCQWRRRTRRRQQMNLFPMILKVFDVQGPDIREIHTITLRTLLAQLRLSRFLSSDRTIYLMITTVTVEILCLPQLLSLSRRKLTLSSSCLSRMLHYRPLSLRVNQISMFASI